MGVMAIQAEESPRVIQSKLVTYLTPAERKTMAGAQEED